MPTPALRTGYPSCTQVTCPWHAPSGYHRLAGWIGGAPMEELRQLPAQNPALVAALRDDPVLRNNGE
ncbi:MAG: hypothetical protein H7Y37_13955 [Anaerolineae bacterium]|nr:hypothetical protein [Gloeobacterales cyanobacterium ES-bin-313]